MATRALEIAGPRRSAWRQALENVPIHVFFIVAGVLWALPAIGLLVTSLRPVGLFTVTGWWTIFTGTGGQVDALRAACVAAWAFPDEVDTAEVVARLVTGA